MNMNLKDISQFTGNYTYLLLRHRSTLPILVFNFFLNPCLSVCLKFKFCKRKKKKMKQLRNFSSFIIVFIFWLFLYSNGELRRHSPFQILQRTFCEPIGSVYFGRTTDTAKRIIFILRTVNIQGNHRVKKFLNTADFIHFRVVMPRCIKIRFIQELFKSRI